MAQVTLTNLCKSYAGKAGREVVAVDSINLEVADGEFMVLVGPSGCGKSTTLRMIAGLEDITGGTVAIDGEIVNDRRPKDRGIAMVFQNYALYPHMTVFENMAFGLKLAGTPKTEIARRVKETAQILGLEDLLERRPAALSGGQRQRVAVGRAIVRQPKVFLFDEPLSNLDAKMRVAMRAEIARLHDRLGATMIYVTHDQVEAMTMGDRICVMHQGRIMQLAPPLDLYRRPANTFVAGFMGTPPMNLLAGTVNPEGFVPTGQTVALPFLGNSGHLAGRALTLGVRPEDLRRMPPEQAHLSTVIELVEPMGAETHLHLRCGQHAMIMRSESEEAPPAGATIRIGCDPARMHLFDTATGESLHPSA